MKYSIWHILLALFALIAVMGTFFVIGISFFFYQFNVKQTIEEHIVNLEIISNAVAGPSWTVKESLYPGTIENILRGARIHETKFIRIINNENKTIEKSSETQEAGMNINNLPTFKRIVSIRDGEFNGLPIKEFSVKARDGSNLWMGISLENIKKNILSAAIMIGGITLILFTITILAVFLLVRNILIKPLILIMEAFEELKNKNFKTRLKNSDTYVTEISEVFASFNEMSQKIKEAKLKMSEELERTREIDRMKSEFISTAAHQLRTPISAVKWVLKMLIDEDLGPLNKEQKTFLIQGYESNERMIKLINDLLNVARIEEGRFGYKFFPIQLEDLIEDVNRDFFHEIKEKELNFEFKKPAKLLPKAMVDPARMRLALQNLIDNAIKYTPKKGKVEISTKQDKMHIEVSVKDTGIGIPKKQQSRLFSKFFRGDNAMKKQTEGTGLGIFIVKNIVEKHGGKISVKSEENKGAEFSFTVPINRF